MKKQLVKEGGQSNGDCDDLWADLEKRAMRGEDFEDVWEAVKKLRTESKTTLDHFDEKLKDDPKVYTNTGPFNVPNLDGVSFYKIPRHSNLKNNVGNVLGKDFVKPMKDRTLKPTGK